jgi:hypothetical protein
MEIRKIQKLEWQLTPNANGSKNLIQAKRVGKNIHG